MIHSTGYALFNSAVNRSAICHGSSPHDLLSLLNVPPFSERFAESVLNFSAEWCEEKALRQRCNLLQSLGASHPS